ncbi:MAG TPA: DUF1501 domain-containing protein [Candidatus Paceibacterota bacterium]|nr:DUF1501 domain-containing protein [Verrucomicrobiota bacterium]HSA09209.1 DUF1501 domain-containing protein [Candidatus Paceibacterota bacterium]
MNKSQPHHAEPSNSPPGGHNPAQAQASMSRREAVQRTLAGAAGLLLTNCLSARALQAAQAKSPAVESATAPATKGKAKAVIQIWIWGGPSHLDTFDPKPEAGNDYCGQFTNPIETSVPGIRINELLPLLAKHADKYSIIRSMTHGINSHETAAYMVQTGWPPGGRVVYPSVGAVVSFFKGRDAGYKGLIPPYIVLTQLQGRFSEAGFLGARYKPFATGGDPAQARFAVEGVVAPGISDKRQQDRRELLRRLNTLEHALPGDAQLATSAQCEKEAYDLILGDAGKVFDLSQEKDAVRDNYGRTTFGQSCLMARRLVERGVPYVTINYSGWDMHKGIFQTLRQRLPQMDRGMAALLQELSERGLLDSTIVWWSGEFGRTPKIQWEPPWNGGRGHYGKVFSAVLAGGGFKGGQVVGASDAKGETVKDRPVYPCDVIGSMYQLLGIDPDAKLPHPQGLTARLTPAATDDVPSGGRLREIM